MAQIAPSPYGLRCGSLIDMVVMCEKRLGELSNLRKRGWPMDEVPTTEALER